MNILTISGSVRSDSSNIRLLDALPALFPAYNIHRYTKLEELPLFHADLQELPDSPPISDWKKALNAAEALIICTPEYLHNIPALLKNALEWITTSGELADKRVLAITLTPHPPRGEKAMQSLIWSLQALKANVVVQLPLYLNEISYDAENALEENECVELLREAVGLLGG